MIGPERRKFYMQYMATKKEIDDGTGYERVSQFVARLWQLYDDLPPNDKLDVDRSMHDLFTGRNKKKSKKSCSGSCCDDDLDFDDPG